MSDHMENSWQVKWMSLLKLTWVRLTIYIKNTFCDEVLNDGDATPANSWIRIFVLPLRCPNFRHRKDLLSEPIPLHPFRPSSTMLLVPNQQDQLPVNFNGRYFVFLGRRVFRIFIGWYFVWAVFRINFRINFNDRYFVFLGRRVFRIFNDRFIDKIRHISVFVHGMFGRHRSLTQVGVDIRWYRIT